VLDISHPAFGGEEMRGTGDTPDPGRGAPLHPQHYWLGIEGVLWTLRQGSDPAPPILLAWYRKCIVDTPVGERRCTPNITGSASQVYCGHSGRERPCTPNITGSASKVYSGHSGRGASLHPQIGCMVNIRCGGSFSSIFGCDLPVFRVQAECSSKFETCITAWHK
jgi:hypothetical protein